MKDSHLCSPNYFILGPTVPQPTFLTLELPLILLRKFSGVRETTTMISTNVIRVLSPFPENFKIHRRLGNGPHF